MTNVYRRKLPFVSSLTLSRIRSDSIYGSPSSPFITDSGMVSLVTLDFVCFFVVRFGLDGGVFVFFNSARSFARRAFSSSDNFGLPRFRGISAAFDVILKSHHSIQISDNLFHFRYFLVLLYKPKP